MDAKERVFNERLKGHCCSETIMALCLEDMGRTGDEREALMRAMGALCGGLHEGLVCGTLSAAKCALFYAEESKAKAHDEWGPELMEWFRERFGAWECAELLEGDETRKMTLCPIIVEDTYLKLRDMLEDMGAA